MNMIKFCSCRMCRFGRHKAGSKAITKRAMRSARRRWNLAAKIDSDDTHARISIPYTD